MTKKGRTKRDRNIKHAHNPIPLGEIITKKTQRTRGDFDQKEKETYRISYKQTTS